MIAGGLSDDQWYALPREARAARVAHLLANEAIRAAAEYDQVEKTRRESKNK